MSNKFKIKLTLLFPFAIVFFFIIVITSIIISISSGLNFLSSVYVVKEIFVSRVLEERKMAITFDIIAIVFSSIVYIGIISNILS